MKLLTHLVDKLKALPEVDISKQRGYQYLNKEVIRGSLRENMPLLQDITEIDIKFLYPNILVGLSKNGLIDKKWNSEIEDIKYFLLNHNHMKGGSDYVNWKSKVNSAFIKIRSSKVGEYLDLFYDDILEELKDDIIIIHVDKLIVKTESVSKVLKRLEEIDSTIYLKDLQLMMVDSIFKWIALDKLGRIESRGFKGVKEEELKLRLELELRKISREKKINQLLN